MHTTFQSYIFIYRVCHLAFLSLRLERPAETATVGPKQAALIATVAAGRQETLFAMQQSIARGIARRPFAGAAQQPVTFRATQRTVRLPLAAPALPCKLHLASQQQPSAILQQAAAQRRYSALQKPAQRRERSAACQAAAASPAGATGGTSTFTQAVFNILNILVGVGLLSVPFALKQAGWIGLALLWGLGIITNYTGKALVECHATVTKTRDPSLPRAGYEVRSAVWAALCCVLTSYKRICQHTTRCIACVPCIVFIRTYVTLLHANRTPASLFSNAEHTLRLANSCCAACCRVSEPLRRINSAATQRFVFLSSYRLPSYLLIFSVHCDRRTLPKLRLAPSGGSSSPTPSTWRCLGPAACS